MARLIARALLLSAVLVLAAVVIRTLVVVTTAPPGDRAFQAQHDTGRPLRIVALGTSLTHHARWPEVLERLLNACLPQGTQVLRHTRPGAASDWGLAEASSVAAQMPDLVIIEFAMNDSDLRDGSWPGESQGNHEAMIAAIRQVAPDAAILLLTTNPVVGKARALRPLLPIYLALYGTIAENADVGLVDGYGRWLSQPDYAEHIPDGVHPDPSFEAALIATPLTDAIRSAFDLRCRQ